MVSIVIPCKTIDKYAQRCIDKCKDVVWPDKEIIVVSDNECLGFPGLKRNYGMDIAKGDIIAFIDSDAYPSADWLINAMRYLETGYLEAVCGPGILPADVSLLEQATDLVLKMLPFSYRVTPKHQRLVTEYPTFNLIVKKTNIRFKNYLTGEDSLFCRELKGRILYTPEVIVYHNRRPLFIPYWKQIATYGLHRGHLIGLAYLGWLSTFIVYPFSFIRGFLRKKYENLDSK